jgi:hypothetical protein
MKHVLLFLTLVAIVGMGWYLAAPMTALDTSSEAASTPYQMDSLARRFARRSLAAHLDFARIRDTVYVLGDRFIEVSLPAQQLTLRYRSGDSLVIPISTGNPDVTEAIATPSGIFSVQSKSPEAISRQFGNTKMLWWIGFNYNIGFHGLEQNSYYRHLGKRPSSHGCIRTGREDVEKLYKLVDVGVPVMVYDSVPARILAFADTANFDTTSALKLGSRSKFMNKVLAKRLEYLYQGKVYERQPYSLYMDARTQLRPGGYATGQQELLERPQLRPLQLASFVQRRPAYWHRDYFSTLQARFDAVQSLGLVHADSTHSHTRSRDSVTVIEPPLGDTLNDNTNATINATTRANQANRAHRKHTKAR